MKQITIEPDMEDAYASSAINFALASFPHSISKDSSQILEGVSAAIFATNRIRYGAMPPPESQVAIREVIRHYIERGEPIPFLSPWGSEKPNGTGIDIAELCAIKTLMCLNARVSEFYKPGIFVNVRVEDVEAPHLFYDRMQQARDEAKLYTDGLVNLVSALGLSFIRITPNSTLVDEGTFNSLADSIVPAVERHLEDVSDMRKFRELHMEGWDKPVAQETVEFYMGGYQRLYPDRSVEVHRHILARYLSGALARFKLGITGALKEWNGKFLEVYFGKTPPGLAASRYARRLHYRTVPSCFTEQHNAPWRSKGYLAIDNNGKATPKLSTFKEQRNYNHFALRFCDGDKRIIVQSDYILL